MTATATLQTRLTEAEAALHALLTGGKPVQLRRGDGSQVQYGQANAGELRTYIAQLKAQLGVRSRRRIDIRF
jgi:hypothetical protein